MDGGWHTTDTIDFLVVLSGEFTLTLDDGVETNLRPGDTVVQNGTRHRGSNRGAVPAAIAITLALGSRRLQLRCCMVGRAMGHRRGEKQGGTGTPLRLTGVLRPVLSKPCKRAELQTRRCQALRTSVRREAAVDRPGDAEHEAGARAAQPEHRRGDRVGAAWTIDRLLA